LLGHRRIARRVLALQAARSLAAAQVLGRALKLSGELAARLFAIATSLLGR